MFFGMSGTELIIVLVVALLILGPSKLPGLARTLGKTVRDFKRATQDIRDNVEIEFYRMDQPSESVPSLEKNMRPHNLADSIAHKEEVEKPSYLPDPAPEQSKIPSKI